MKKTILAFGFFAILSFVFAHADVVIRGQGQQVVINSKTNTNGHNHTEVNPPADMPDVYYNNVSGIITIVDYANVTYYVTIYDDWWNAVITDTKVGGGTIDVSSLSTGDYIIDITTSWNHEYEGEFTVP